MSQYSHWSPGQQHPHGVFQTPSQPQFVTPSAQNDLDEPFGYSNDQQAIFESTVAHGYQDGPSLFSPKNNASGMYTGDGEWGNGSTMMDIDSSAGFVSSQDPIGTRPHSLQPTAPEYFPSPPTPAVAIPLSTWPTAPNTRLPPVPVALQLSSNNHGDINDTQSYSSEVFLNASNTSPSNASNLPPSSTSKIAPSNASSSSPFNATNTSSSNAGGSSPSHSGSPSSPNAGGPPPSHSGSPSSPNAGGPSPSNSDNPSPSRTTANANRSKPRTNNNYKTTRPGRNSSDKDADKLLFKLTKLELMLQKQMDLGVQSSKPSMPDPLANYAPGLVKRTILAPTQAIRQLDSDRTSAMKMLEKERPEWGLVRRVYIRHGAVYFVYKNINDAMTFQPDPDSMARALGMDVTTFEYFPETYYVEIIFHGKRIYRDVQNSVNYDLMFEDYDIKFGTSNKCMMKGSRFILQLGDKETAWRLLSAYESEMDDFQIDYCRADVRAIDIRSVWSFCFHCAEPGHMKKDCSSEAPRCGRCSSDEHESRGCNSEVIECPNCGGSHTAWCSVCPDMKRYDMMQKCLGFAGLEPRWASDRRKEEAAKNSPAGESSAAEGSASSPIDLFSDSVSHASSDKCKGKARESFAASVEPMDLHPGGRPVASGIGHSSRKTKGKATAADRNITPHKGGAKRARFSHSSELESQAQSLSASSQHRPTTSQAAQCDSRQRSPGRGPSASTRPAGSSSLATQRTTASLRSSSTAVKSSNPSTSRAPANLARPSRNSPSRMPATTARQTTSSQSRSSPTSVPSSRAAAVSSPPAVPITPTKTSVSSAGSPTSRRTSGTRLASTVSTPRTSPSSTGNQSSRSPTKSASPRARTPDSTPPSAQAPQPGPSTASPRSIAASPSQRQSPRSRVPPPRRPNQAPSPHFKTKGNNFFCRKA